MKGWTKSFSASLIVSVMIFCMFYVSFGIVEPKIAMNLLRKPETPPLDELAAAVRSYPPPPPPDLMMMMLMTMTMTMMMKMMTRTTLP